jgi:hypothetical protein
MRRIGITAAAAGVLLLGATSTTARAEEEDGLSWTYDYTCHTNGGTHSLSSGGMDKGGGTHEIIPNNCAVHPPHP